jgi:hypothetical protein
MVEFMITHAKKEGFYKVLLAETDKDLMVEDEKVLQSKYLGRIPKKPNLYVDRLTAG